LSRFQQIAAANSVTGVAMPRAAPPNAQGSLLRKFIDCDVSAPRAQPSSKIVPSLRIGFRIGVIE